MQRPACGTVIEAGRKFCHECGSKLAAACPSCGSANQPGARFCGECGAKLTAGDAAAMGATKTTVASSGGTAPVAERRIVSVLFADLVGFTTLAEGRDAEAVRELLSSYFELSRDLIGRYGGTVEKFIGDAVMAVWGAPTVEAGILGIEGRTTDAIAGFRAALQRWRDYDLPWDEAVTGWLFLAVVGPSKPEAVAAGKASRVILDRLGAAPIIAQVDALLAQAESTRSSSAAASSTDVGTADDQELASAG